MVIQQGCQGSAMGSELSFQQIRLGQMDIHVQKNVGAFPHTYTKNNLKWIKYLNVKAKSIKLVEEHIGVNLHEL